MKNVSFWHFQLLYELELQSSFVNFGPPLLVYERLWEFLWLEVINQILFEKINFFTIWEQHFELMVIIPWFRNFSLHSIFR